MEALRHAHALNLKDSGVENITIGLRPGSSSAERAEKAGLALLLRQMQQKMRILL